MNILSGLLFLIVLATSALAETPARKSPSPPAKPSARATEPKPATAAPPVSPAPPESPTPQGPGPQEDPSRVSEKASSPSSFLSVGTAPETDRSVEPDWVKELGLGGHARFDYYSASKRLDNNHSLPGLTFQPKLQPKFGTWGDAKIEGRFTDQDLGDHREPKQGRLLEAYTNLYLGSVDVRVGKQNIPWGRADALNPTDNLTPKDFTLLSARDEEERRIGTVGVRTNYYRGDYTLSLIWLPIFNPSTIPLTPSPGFQITEDKRSQGKWSDQAFAAKLDHTGGAMDWSVSYYYGLDTLPIGRPLSQVQAQLIHNRIHVIGADFAKNFGRYGVRGEMAYTQTQNPNGTDPFIKNPFFMSVLGIDRDITEDLNINVQAYQRIIVNFNDPFAIQDPIQRNVAVLSDTFNQQLDQYQGGFTSRIKATWLNKTLEGEILGMLNLPRRDFFVRPSFAYAFTDVWKGYVGWDIFNGQRDSFFGRLQPNTAFFAEIRAAF
ncbi:MAG: hypothetical protein H0W13_05490 [Nitrospirales bacterium]|nr:hypothetical protein [Nitrospirales bacterium]